MDFEWVGNKNAENTKKHGIGFEDAQYAFADPHRVISRNKKHSTKTEERFFCYGKIGEMIVTVRFICRRNKIRIIGAGYWREGKKIYEKINNL